MTLLFVSAGSFCCLPVAETVVLLLLSFVIHHSSTLRADKAAAAPAANMTHHLHQSTTEVRRRVATVDVSDIRVTQFWELEK